jgi:hypothetical protein
LKVERSDPDAWPWPDALDALQAAPLHHRIVFENDRVRVLDTRIGPGDTTPMHTHRWPAVHHLMSWSDFVRRDANGKVLVDTRGRSAPTSLPFVVWSESLSPHSLENVGAAVLQVVSIELKEAPAPVKEARP